jgi:hypothetical protein
MHAADSKAIYLVVPFQASAQEYKPVHFLEEMLGWHHGEHVFNRCEDAIATCWKGPKAEGYWDAWKVVFASFNLFVNGRGHFLREDDGGNLYLVCDDLMTSAEREHFCLDA